MAEKRNATRRASARQSWVHCTKLSGSYKVFLETSGIYVVATKLICADGTEQLHAIYLDCERDVVHFGYNDYGDDMISFLIEKPDRRDTTL